MLNIFQRMRRRIEMHRGHAIKIFIAWLVTICVMHVAAMMIIEDMSFSDACWYSMACITTIGFGDVSAKTPFGRLTTFVLMVVCGIFILAAFASLLFERAAERRERKINGKWRWKLDNHILVISTTGSEQTRYLSALISQLRADPAHGDRPIMMMTHGFDAGGLPDALSGLNVVYARGDGDSDDEMALGSVAKAHLVVVLGDDRTPKADAFVFDVVSRIRGAGFTGRIVSECEDDRNRARLSTGDMDACVRPTRGYPEMLARAIVAPGSERVIEEIFTFGGTECEYIDLGSEVPRGAWRDLVGLVMQHDLGTPVAYRSGTTVVTAPPASTMVSARGVYVLMGQNDQEMCKSKLKLLLAA